MEFNGDQKLFGDQILIFGQTIPLRTFLKKMSYDFH